MSWLTRGLSSSVGLKFLMGATGILLVLFVVGHMLGNLQVFLGPDALNHYAAKLQGLGGFLWVIRFGLLAVFAVHVLTGIVLELGNRAARPVAYRRRDSLESTVFSRTMIWSGLALLAFVTYHLLHFTFHATNPEHVATTMLDGEEHKDVYRMVILGFQQAPIAISYVVAMGLLGFHLAHGVGSIFQSLGWNHPKYEPLWSRLGATVAVILVIGNVAMPLCVLLGVVGLPESGLQEAGLPAGN